MNNKGVSSTYRLVGYLLIVTSAALCGFNGNVSRLLFDQGVTPVALLLTSG